jgi:hypothetical protein
MNTTTARTPKLLAQAFSFQLRETLTPEQMAQVIARNAHYRECGEKDICASHEFCDANVTMDDAFKMLGLTVIDSVSGEISGIANELWNAAWDIAKASDFDVPAHLREFPELFAFGGLGFDVPEEWEDRSESASSPYPCFALRTAQDEAGVCGEFVLDVDNEDADPGQRLRLHYFADARDNGANGWLRSPHTVLETSDPVAMSMALHLIALREEVRDWQDALAGEREGLDELCAGVDDLLRGDSVPDPLPESPPSRLLPRAGV